MSKPVTAIAELIEPAWDRQPNEPTDWFIRFCAYRNQVGKRSLRAAYGNEMALSQSLSKDGSKSGKRRDGKSGTVPSAWDTIFDKWRWAERVEAFDLDKQDQADREWDERMQQLRANRWQQYEAIRVKAETMLKMPLVEATTRDEGNGAVTTIINPTDWSQFLEAAKLLVIGDRLGELAVGNLNTAATLLHRAGFKVEPPSPIDNALGFDSEYAEPESDEVG